MTNYEKIKNMSVEEMAILLNDIATCLNVEERADCIPFIEKWLNSEVEE